MKPPLIKCACCNGTGEHELEPVLWSTLQRLRSFEPPVVRPLLDEIMVTPNAINNRLLALESLGLIRRVGKDGKFILWEARPPAKKRQGKMINR